MDCIYDLWQMVLNNQLRTIRRGCVIAAGEAKDVCDGVVVVIQFESQTDLRESAIACGLVDRVEGRAGQVDGIPAIDQSRFEGTGCLAGSADASLKVCRL